MNIPQKITKAFCFASMFISGIQSVEHKYAVAQEEVRDGFFIKAALDRTPLPKVLCKLIFEYSALCRTRHINLQIHTPRLTPSCLLMPGNKLLISVKNDVRLFDIATGSQVKNFSGHIEDVTALMQVSEDQFISSARNSSPRIWNYKTGDCIRLLRGKHLTHLLTKLPGTELAAVGWDGTITVWNYETDALLRSFNSLYKGTRKQRHRVNSLIQTSEQELASASDDGTICIWDYRMGEYARTINASADGRGMFAMIQLSEKEFATGSRDKCIRIWNYVTGECVKQMPTTYSGNCYAKSTLAKLSQEVLISGFDRPKLGNSFQYERGFTLLNYKTGEPLEEVEAAGPFCKQLSPQQFISYGYQNAYWAEFMLWEHGF